MAAKERVRTLVIRVDDEGSGQQDAAVRLGQTDLDHRQTAGIYGPTKYF